MHSLFAGATVRKIGLRFLLNNLVMYRSLESLA